MKSLNSGLVLLELVCVLIVGCAGANRKHNVYDYIVVGAGAAGSIVAKELSDDYSKQVLLIEAGPYRDNDPNVLNPSGFSAVAAGPIYNFDYYTHPVLPLAGRRLSAAQGRMWGGSSSHNFMVYVRGNAYDYDQWALSGGGGDKWSAARMLPLFKQMENTSLVNVRDTQKFLQYHGTSGRVNTLTTPPQKDMFTAFAGALDSVLGVKINDDYNGATQEGAASAVQFTQRYDNNGQLLRESSSTAYLSPDIVQLNDEGDGIGVNGRQLTVHSNSFATKLIINSNKVVVGVEYLKNGKQRVARVNYDVIVSAGSIQSPPLLMRSGIGNCTELATLGISCTYHNPQVGKNLQDHTLLPVFGKKQTDRPFDYYTTMFGFYKSSLARDYTNLSVSSGETVVDTAIVSNPGFLPTVREEAVRRGWETVDPLTGQIRNQYAFTVHSMLLRPKCKGKISISSKDPLVSPVFELDYLCDPLDIEWANRNLGELISVVKGMSERDPTISLVYPTPDILTPENRNYTVRTLVAGVWHYTSSLSMGKVVDSNLCVKGVAGLRVADASIMPFPVSGNTNAPTMAIGKNAADIIKQTKACVL